MTTPSDLMDFAVAHGLTHIVPHPTYPDWILARDPGGLPVVVMMRTGTPRQAPAWDGRDVGPGPALEGRIRRGRRWWGVPKLVGFDVQEWRLAAPEPT